MASFAYSAINALGAESAGQVTAPDVSSARELLRQKGLRPVSLSQVGGADAVGSKKQKKVKQRFLQVFSRQFATMIDAGLSVVQSLVILEQQTDDKNLALVIREVRADVEGGMLLSQAMARHPNAFDRLYISMIEAGEAAGILDTVLDRVALQIEKEMKIRRRVKGAMIYPLVVLGFAIAHADRDAPVPRPGFPGNLRRPRRRPADADEGRRRRIGPRPRLLVHPLPGDRPLDLGLPALEEDTGRAGRCGIDSSCASPQASGRWS